MSKFKLNTLSIYQGVATREFIPTYLKINIFIFWGIKWILITPNKSRKE